MRPWHSQGIGGMSLEQGGYGPGQYAYEQAHSVALRARWDDAEDKDVCPFHPATREGLDAGLEGNPNRGASREKLFGLGEDWVQRVWLEKWEHASVSGVQYFLICPGPPEGSTPSATGVKRSSVNSEGLKGMTGTTSNCGDGSRGAHGKGWICGQRVYKLFWLLARDSELRDALLAEAWINGLSSGQLSRQSAAVSGLINRYGPIMGQGRVLRCRRCLRLRYGQSPEVLRKKRRIAATDDPTRL